MPSLYAGYLDPKIARKESLDSFTALTNHVLDYNIWAVKTDSPFKTVADVVAAAKKAPEKITVTAFGDGGDDHLAILSIQAETGAKFAIVHMRGTADAKTQVLGGHVQVLGANVSEVAEEVRAGQLRVLGRHGTGALPLSPRCADLQGAGPQPGLVGLARRRCAGRAFPRTWQRSSSAPWRRPCRRRSIARRPTP